MFYKQVVVKKMNEESAYGEFFIHHCWVPEQFAKVGKFLRILIGVDWENGWEVIEVGERKEEQFVLEDSQDYKHQRKASDI
jgi:hypothetical protein